MATLRPPHPLTRPPGRNWINEAFSEWVSIRAVLTGTYQQWIGNDYLNP